MPFLIKLEFILTLIGQIIIIFLVIKAIQNLYKTGKAIAYAFKNPLKCKTHKEECPVILKQQTPVITEDITKWDLNQARYNFNLVQRVAKAATEPPYEPPDDIDNYADLYNDKEDPVFGKIMMDKNKSTIWIIIRGTTNVGEMMQDINISQKAFNIKSKTKQISPKFLSSFPGNSMVHEGFLEVYMNFRQKMLDTLNKINAKNKKIIVAGHSLGAGVATIAASELKTIYPNVAAYVYASPRVGNKDFCDFVNSRLPLFRIVNTTDVIPTVPPSVTPNFSDRDSPFFYNHCGKLFTFTLNWKSLLNNHITPVYAEGLKLL